MAILVKTLAILMNYKSSKATSEEISALARQGSGSACRSVFGGFAEWIAESETNKEIKSHGVQIKDEKFWENFNISLLIVSDKKKDKGSTDGMKLSRETSEFLKVKIK
jgi:diphosphomevalonate decarboxylase